MHKTSVPILASVVFILFACSAQARAQGLDLAGRLEGVQDEMAAAPLRDVPAQGAPQVGPDVLASLGEGDWLFEGRISESEDGDEPAITNYPATCLTSADLRTFLQTSPVDQTYACTSQARTWPRGAHQLWTCSRDEQTFTVNRLAFVRDEVFVMVESNSTSSEFSTLDTEIVTAATTAHGGACPGASR